MTLGPEGEPIGQENIGEQPPELKDEGIENIEHKTIHGFLLQKSTFQDGKEGYLMMGTNKETREFLQQQLEDIRLAKYKNVKNPEQDILPIAAEFIYEAPEVEEELPIFRKKLSELMRHVASCKEQKANVLQIQKGAERIFAAK
jgi:hypothetical protein